MFFLKKTNQQLEGEQNTETTLGRLLIHFSLCQQMGRLNNLPWNPFESNIYTTKYIMEIPKKEGTIVPINMIIWIMQEAINGSFTN